MLKRIKDINEALPGMLLIECIYLIIAEIIIFVAVPNKIMCAVGLLAGVIYAVFSSFHLSFTIRKVVYGGHKQSSTLVLGYIVRFLVMIILECSQRRLQHICHLCWTRRNPQKGKTVLGFPRLIKI